MSIKIIDFIKFTFLYLYITTTAYCQSEYIKTKKIYLCNNKQYDIYYKYTESSIDSGIIVNNCFIQGFITKLNEEEFIFLLDKERKYIAKPGPIFTCEMFKSNLLFNQRFKLKKTGIWGYKYFNGKIKKLVAYNNNGKKFALYFYSKTGELIYRQTWGTYYRRNHKRVTYIKYMKPPF